MADIVMLLGINMDVHSLGGWWFDPSPLFLALVSPRAKCWTLNLPWSCVITVQMCVNSESSCLSRWTVCSSMCHLRINVSVKHFEWSRLEKCCSTQGEGWQSEALQVTFVCSEKCLCKDEDFPCEMFLFQFPLFYRDGEIEGCCVCCCLAFC